MSEIVTHIMVNSFLFIFIVALVLGWIITIMLGDATMTDKIRDCFIATSFLTFFLVQRTLNKYNRAMQVKLNELVKAQDNASNELVNVEKKTNKEIEDISKELHEKENT